ncbi:radical SAM superfamily enzyme YgiQ (UPF0313 family) [Skermanella aerolata]|uniref:B12-binding domain-containing radical SAM protein n=1 Tax=Skermanella aerolata TaxID=393310 RepID=UPI003D1955A3
MSIGASIKPNLLAIVPPYAIWGPPAGAAALLAYLKAAGCHDFSFLDLRLFAPDVTKPTYREIGPFGESFVLDVPDLPLVLAVLEQFRLGGDLLDLPDAIVEPFCQERGLNSLHLRSYLARMGHLVTSVFDRIPELHFVGFSVWTSNYLTTLLAAACLKRRKDAPFIVAGGPQVSQSSTAAQLGLRAGLFDAVVVGEGEQALLDLYAGFSSTRRKVAAQVGGTLAIDPDDGAFVHKPRGLLKLQELPLPDFDEMHLPAYSLGGKRVVSYQLSRGCTDKCSFCSEWVLWERFRLTQMDRAVADVRELQRRWGAERIWFTDSLLNGSPNHLRTFAQGLIDKDVRIDWSGYMRAQTDAETAQLLRRSGCMWVFVGVESLDDETLRRMNKRRTEQQNLDAVQAFLDAGIQVKVGLIPGFPGDTPKSFLRTAARLHRMMANHRLLGVSHEAFTVLPGQPIYDDLDAFGLTPIPWSDEVLGIAPALSDIAARSRCRVEGANQGIDRLGEYAVSLSLTGPAQPFDGDADHLREKITAYDLATTALGDDVWLVRTVSSLGHTVGLLLTTGEQRDLLSCYVEGVRPVPVCDAPEPGAAIRRLLASHAVGIPPEAPPVAAARYRSLPPLAEGASLAIGPHTIARRIGSLLWLANLATGNFHAIGIEDIVAAAILCGAELPMLPTAVDLTERGLLVYATLPAAAPAAAPRDRRPASPSA